MSIWPPKQRQKNNNKNNKKHNLGGWWVHATLRRKRQFQTVAHFPLLVGLLCRGAGRVHSDAARAETTSSHPRALLERWHLLCFLPAFPLYSVNLWPWLRYREKKTILGRDVTFRWKLNCRWMHRLGEFSCVLWIRVSSLTFYFELIRHFIGRLKTSTPSLLYHTGSFPP